MAGFDLATYLGERKTFIERQLDRILPAEAEEPREVSAAMRYGTLRGGKRLRPLMALVVAEINGFEQADVSDAACAIELVHAASLILDDLPSMDDARTRRGQPCTHLVFGESTAVLAAMDLIAIAYRLVADNADRRGRPAAPVIAQLSNAIGHDGIVRGQHADLAVRRKRATLDQLTEIYTHKAAALFLAAVRIPASILDIDSNKLQALEAYALNLGLAFQITDDLLDAGHAPEDAGRTTFSTHLGIAGAETRVRELVANATAALSVFGDEAVALKALAEYVGIRKQ
ncbi:MAG TPA: polyprenyl synthetase family protein [Candidatus Hydrogenedentes bacterium]|jgi:geranylgeranyl pyrophosphate synthase|nr:polyprenyl synthetase family protein [Candidatus Hydrogenedentota bacterium]MDY0030478.1 polyprenyl synthetase family protein [FCB group bacterium]NLT60402.1 polyprenyl synthetase family protein [Candidatus Hydrogenedentota bacterium]HNZ18851.1 polyprenyl synthetase family protein [Candidatus Hydrogenedentota bacterium]HOH34229.1 polyprenyl synthetase family protein [Candidatus Hydrogenedentota bacterium]